MEQNEIHPGRYRHFKGMEYEVIGVAKHSESLEEMVVYRAVYGDGALWVRPAAMWCETVTRDGVTMPRFTRIEMKENADKPNDREDGWGAVETNLLK